MFSSTQWDENGQKELGMTYKDGKKDDFESWYENGNKRATSTFKNEKMMTQTRWKPNGEKCPVTNVVNGNGVVVVYEEDGTEKRRWTYKGGDYVPRLTHPYRPAAMKRLPRPED